MAEPSVSYGCMDFRAVTTFRAPSLIRTNVTMHRHAYRFGDRKNLHSILRRHYRELPKWGNAFNVHTSHQKDSLLGVSGLAPPIHTRSSLNMSINAHSSDSSDHVGGQTLDSTSQSDMDVEKSGYTPPWRRRNAGSGTSELAIDEPTKPKGLVPKKYAKAETPPWLPKSEIERPGTPWLRTAFVPLENERQQSPKKAGHVQKKQNSDTTNRDAESETVRSASNTQSKYEFPREQTPEFSARLANWSKGLNSELYKPSLGSGDSKSWIREVDRTERKPWTGKADRNSVSKERAAEKEWNWRERFKQPTESMEQGTTEKYPWTEKKAAETKKEEKREPRVKEPSRAELTMEVAELKRVRTLAMSVRSAVKVGRLGITEGVVEFCHNGWKNHEIVKLRCQGPPAYNMKKTVQDLEEMTGGLVIWQSGGSIALYRGANYMSPFRRRQLEESESPAPAAESEGEGESPDTSAAVEEAMDGEESGDVTHGLGPKVAGWQGRGFAPVDADLLLNRDIEYEKPFRMLPYGVKHGLSNNQLTELRRESRKLLPHFVLGRNKGLEGLAAAMVKLWDRIPVIKIQVKRNVINTSNERMAEELKKLTGGILLARDKFYIVFHRGKDFLPSDVASTLRERHQMAVMRADLDERDHLLRLSSKPAAEAAAGGVLADTGVSSSSDRPQLGTLEESLQLRKSMANFQSRSSRELEEQRQAVIREQKVDLAKAVHRKLLYALTKMQRAALEVAKLDEILQPAAPPRDRESITEEERYMFTKLGNKMKAYLELGKRGVFAGVVENMHLHWKHRELVKVICKEKEADVVQRTAQSLEYESGGILVSVVPIKRGFSAIIFYRGKNYVRPETIRPKTLLTKRQALKRATEEQRRRSLLQHIQQVHSRVADLRSELVKLEIEAGRKPGELTGDIDLMVEQASKGPDRQLVDEFVQRRAAKQAAHDRKKAERAARLQAAVAGPTHIAGPLTRKKQLLLREEALRMGRRATFQMGRSNVVSGLARAIRIAFLQQRLVKVGIKGRAPGTPVEDIVRALERETGGVFVSREPSKIILYRGFDSLGQVAVDVPAEDTINAAAAPGEAPHVEAEGDVAVIVGDALDEESEGEGWDDEFGDADGDVELDDILDSVSDDEDEEDEEDDYDEQEVEAVLDKWKDEDEDVGQMKVKPGIENSGRKLP